MSAQQPPDLPEEREIDLRRWRDAILARRWFVVAGLVAGLVVGGLYSLSGASTYSATVTLEPAQPYNSSGEPVLNYSSSPLAITSIVTSTAALRVAAAAAHMPIGQLRGHVSVASISTGVGPVTERGTVLEEITVALPQSDRAEKAANALGHYVVVNTESKYVSASIAAYVATDSGYTGEIASVEALIASYKKTLAGGGLSSFEALYIATLADSAYTRLGNLETLLFDNEQSLSLARTIEVAQIINPAVSSKAVARSRRDSIIFGGVIGLLLGAIVALFLGLRPPRTKPAG